MILYKYCCKAHYRKSDGHNLRGEAHHKEYSCREVYYCRARGEKGYGLEVVPVEEVKSIPPFGGQALVAKRNEIRACHKTQDEGGEKAPAQKVWKSVLHKCCGRIV